ncbi:FG-GAP-like repeat-containing protein [Bacteroidota bacterium]
MRIFLFSIITSITLFAGCQRNQVSQEQKDQDIITSRNLGMAFIEENRLEDAEKEFKTVIKYAPDEASGYANLGLVYLRMGKYPQAEKQLLTAADKSPQDPDIRLMLAKAYELNGKNEESLNTLNEILSFAPDHAKTLYALSEQYTKMEDAESLAKRETYLHKIVDSRPVNLVTRLLLTEVLLKTDNTADALWHLEAIKQIFPEFRDDALAFYNQTVKLSQEGQTEEALTSMKIFHNFLKLTSLYQSGIIELKGQGGPLIGFPVITVGQPISTFIPEGESLLDAIKYTDVTETAGLGILQNADNKENNNSEFSTHVTVGDYDGDGDQDLYVGNFTEESDPMLFRYDMGRFEDVTRNAGIRHDGKETTSIFADYDNDGHVDLYISRVEGDILYHNNGNGTFRDLTNKSKIENSNAVYQPLFFDIDHEGDLDLFLARSNNDLLFRNNGNGTFEEKSDITGITGTNAKSSDVAFGDFDEDGDIDLFVVKEVGPNALFSNQRESMFKNIASESGLGESTNSGAVTVADYDNDGYLDIFLTAIEGGKHELYRNQGNGTFQKENRCVDLYKALETVAGYDATFLDFDNDGFQDLVVIGESSTPGDKGVKLFHNEKSGIFTEMLGILPDDLVFGRKVAISDYNEDGDMDMFISDLDGNVRLLRNDGGNANRYLKIQLVGMRTGSGKNNHFGIGAKLEIRAADLYQMKVVTEPVVHFGLGHRTKADVIRILWTNGVPQNLFDPKSDQDLIEEQVLKGSCPFLYTWNGEKYVFVKDVMWRSALGMPMGIMGGTATYAFADASDDYIKIPGELLKPKEGKYSLQITEELWETIYFDKVELVAVDHPESTEIFVDEQFSPPPFPGYRIYAVDQKHIPESVTDEKGNDLVPLISGKDDRYISNFKLDKFQGVTEMKDLVIDLGKLAQTDSIYLFLQGWIYPTDASINAAISQDREMKSVPPYIETINEHGVWETIIPQLGFPMGKDKTVIVDLSGKIRPDDPRIRIRTNMQIYWDHIFYSSCDSGTPVQSTRLKPESADHHFRGFSSMFRKGGPYGPHWFDYYDVTTGQKWRDLTGDYTRYGDVNNLLQEADDMYIIANAGDETTIEFKASDLPVLLEGWKRDFLINCVGWVKDGDLNTALGQTVDPLPFHGMSRYPYGTNETYPSDPEHKKYRDTYNTRPVNTKKFRQALSLNE